MKAWYFSNTEKTLGYGDGRPIVLGETHTVDGEPVVCHRGLHGSKRLLDAFNYASGPVIWRVELGGKFDIGTDKIAATERTYFSGGIDITDILRKFARLCALDVIHLWDAPDIVVQFLKTGDESLMAAASAATWNAGAAAWAAAWDAVRAAAWAATWDAVRAAARDAVRDAARDAVRAAAWHDAREAAWAKQNRRLTAMVSRAIKEEL